MEVPDKIERKWIGTRVAFSLAAVACYFGTLSMLAWLVSKPDAVIDQVLVWSALEVLLYILGAAIVGDTARPSGMKNSAFLTKKRARGKDDG